MTRQWLAGLGLLAAGLVAGWSAARSQAPPGDKPDPAPAAGKAADRGRPLGHLVPACPSSHLLPGIWSPLLSILRY